MKALGNEGAKDGEALDDSRASVGESRSRPAARVTHRLYDITDCSGAQRRCGAADIESSHEEAPWSAAGG